MNEIALGCGLGGINLGKLLNAERTLTPGGGGCHIGKYIFLKYAKVCRIGYCTNT